MANKICRITILAFIFGDIPKGIENGYNNDDLENGIQYCKELQDEGLSKEPHDQFCLKSYITWAQAMIEK